MSGARFYPALDITWPSAPASDLIDLVIAAVDEASPTAVEERPNGVRIFFATPDERDRSQPLAATAAPGASIACVSISDEAWAERSQADLQPVTVGRITVAPPWAVGVTSTGSGSSPILLTIQPSMGFGTGHHPSTRLCLRLLQDEDLVHRSVFDAGTGSGVLALTAWRLGASHVTAIDYDPDAVTAARENLDRNGADDRLSLEVGDLSRIAAGLAGRFDLALANLTGAVLTRFASQLVGCLAAGGALIASGFQADEVAELVAAFRAAGARPDTTVEEDSWVAIRFVTASPTDSTAR